MIKKLMAGLLASTLAWSALAAPAAIDPALIDQAKREAAAAVGSATSQTYQVDANGNPVVGADGKPIMRANSTDTLQGHLRMFQATTGVSGVESVSSPGQSGQAGVAKVSINQAFDFLCSSGRSSAYAAGGLAFKVDNCAFSGAAVQTVTFAVCDNGLKAGTCATDPDYSQAVQVSAGTFAAFNSLQLGLGCNSVGKCRLTVQGSYQMGGSDQSLKDSAAQASSGSTLMGALRDTVTSDNYSGQMKSIGQPLVDCVNRSPSAAAGTYSTCDGTQSVSVNSSTNTAQCSTTKTCIKEAISVNAFTKSCTRRFPTTQRLSTRQYDKTASCNIVETTGATASVVNSCHPAAGPRLESGMTLVSETAKVCNNTAVKPDGTSECVSNSWTQYWVNLTDVKMLSTVESPVAVAGACDAPQVGDTRTEACTGEWFGRLLPTDQCTVQYDGGSVQLNYSQQAGCGVCLQQKTGQTCYGVPSATDEVPPDSCATTDLTSCTMQSNTPLTFTSDVAGGLVTSQKEVYSCHADTKQCVQWQTTPSSAECLSTDMSKGLDQVGTKPTSSTGSMNNALVAAAMLDNTGKAIEGVQDATIPLLFGGEYASCHKPDGWIGDLLAKSCCNTGLQRPEKGNLFQSGCDMGEAKLAAARRSRYSHFVAPDYCSREFHWLFGSTCLERRETYCTFQGILPRLIAEQGRSQLQAMTGSSYSDVVKDAPYAFKYYDTNGGSWAPAVTVNGVQVAAWQWPSYCSDPALAAQKVLENQGAKECPGVVSTWFAACDAAAGCGTLPAEPGEGSLNWTMHNADPLESITTGISKFAVVRGACSPTTQNCSYVVSAWPVGTGGKAVVTKDITWVLFGGKDTAASSAQAAQAYQLNNIGDLMFKGYSVAGSGGALPATVPLGYSTDGGQTWAKLNLSTDLKTTDSVLPGTDVHVTGACDTTTNECSYRVTGTVTISSKSFGYNRGPDCSGFTAGQLSVLDFSKMDLSEWLATVMDKSGTLNPTDMANKASAQFQEFNSLYQSGKVKGTAPTSPNFARVVPAEGFGPFDVRLAVSGFWPEVNSDSSKNVDPVSVVEVDWGDCSAKQTLTAVAPSEGTGFRGLHRYNGPADPSHGCLATTPGDNLHRNVTHVVTMTVRTARSGTQVRTVKVENAWAQFPGGNSNNDNVASPVTVSTQASSGTPPASK